MHPAGLISRRGVRKKGTSKRVKLPRIMSIRVHVERTDDSFHHLIELRLNLVELAQRMKKWTKKTFAIS